MESSVPGYNAIADRHTFFRERDESWNKLDDVMWLQRVLMALFSIKRHCYDLYTSCNHTTVLAFAPCARTVMR